MRLCRSLCRRLLGLGGVSLVLGWGFFVRTGCYGAAWGVNVEVDWFGGVVGFEEEELGDN